LPKNATTPEVEMTNGLFMGHAYSITGIAVVGLFMSHAYSITGIAVVGLFMVI
jgi:hypothetical protein